MRDLQAHIRQAVLLAGGTWEDAQDAAQRIADAPANRRYETYLAILESECD